MISYGNNKDNNLRPNLGNRFFPIRLDEKTRTPVTGEILPWLNLPSRNSFLFPKEYIVLQKYLVL